MGSVHNKNMCFELHKYFSRFFIYLFIYLFLLLLFFLIIKWCMCFLGTFDFNGFGQVALVSSLFPPAKIPHIL